MNREKIKDDLRHCTEEQLGAIRGILQFNLQGLFVGCVEEAAEKLRMVEDEIDRRKNTPQVFH